MRSFLSHRPILLLVLVSLGLGLSGCSKQRAVGPAGSAVELPDQEVDDFALTETDEGHPQWKLYAQHAATFSSRNLTTANGVRVDFFGDDGKLSSTLTANGGEINNRSRDMTARGNVVLQTTEGTRLSTQVLRYLNERQKIVVPDDQLVRVQRAGDVLTGYGFESDPDLSHYEFRHRVQATVRTQSGGTIAPRSGP